MNRNNFNIWINNHYCFNNINPLHLHLYQYEEFQSKENFVDYTNIPFFEKDITKELLPVKFSKSINNINNFEIREVIDELNLSSNLNFNDLDLYNGK